MTLRLLLALPVAALAVCSGGCGRATPEQDFWRWFERNEPTLFDYEKDRERTFDRLISELHKVNSSLTFEFGPRRDGRREFTLSADGVLAAFPKVESLYAAAPALPRWHFLKFRQRQKPTSISFGGVSVDSRAVKAQAEPAGQKVDLTLFVPGYSETDKQTYNAITFLFLDQTLGEYDVEMRVGGIVVRPVSEAPAQTCSLEKLPEVFDAFLKTISGPQMNTDKRR